MGEITEEQGPTEKIKKMWSRRHDKSGRNASLVS
jgi:hypothetical protein